MDDTANDLLRRYLKQGMSDDLERDILTHLTKNDTVSRLSLTDEMSKQMALDKARELWGETARVYDRAEHPETNWNHSLGLKWVGCPEFRDIDNKWIYGNGDTWEQAFEEAAKRQKAMVR